MTRPVKEQGGSISLGIRDIEAEQSQDAPVLLDKLDGTLKVVDEGDWSAVPDEVRTASQRLADRITKLGVDVVTHPEVLEQLGITEVFAPINGERLGVVETLDRVPGLGGDLFGEGVARGLELLGSPRWARRSSARSAGSSCRSCLVE